MNTMLRRKPVTWAIRPKVGRKDDLHFWHNRLYWICGSSMSKEYINLPSYSSLSRTPTDISGPEWAARKKTPEQGDTLPDFEVPKVLFRDSSSGFYRWYPRPFVNKLAPFCGYQKTARTVFGYG